MDNEKQAANAQAFADGKLSIKEKISYALGDGAANIAWRGVSTFLMFYYIDVFGLAPAIVATLMLVVRLSDGISDVVMGAIADRTNSKYGKFRPWVLWTALPLAIILSLLFTCPDWSENGKIFYAYATYILFTLIYTANNIPYGSLMAVMTPDDKERTSLGSYRMVGAFAGGMLVQGLLLFLVSFFGNVDPQINITNEGADKYTVTIEVPRDVENMSIETKNGVALISAPFIAGDTPAVRKSFTAQKGVNYSFSIEGEAGIDKDSFRIVDQRRGYSYSIYALSFVLAACLLLTFLGTRERVEPPAKQETNLSRDLADLIKNYPWLILVAVGLLYNIYNNTKQGITLIYFTHYVHDQILAASYMIGLMIASIAGAMITTPLSNKYGKKNLFIGALIFSAAVNSLICLCGPGDTVLLFAVGMISEVGAAIFPTLFFAMLGDVADYSEFVNKRRATGLVYSAGSFATKFGGGIAGWIIGTVLSLYGYDAASSAAIEGAIPAIVMLMSWLPAILCVIAAVLMLFYPIDQQKSTEMTQELQRRRAEEAA